MAVRFTKQEDKPADSLNVSTDNSDNKIVSKLKEWQGDCADFVSTWESNQEKWHKMRMRIKKEKNFPFVGCANLRMPTIEIKIRKLKAALMNVIFGIRPIVQAVPSEGANWESARKVEKFLDHIIMDKMKLKPKAAIAIDQALERGFFLLKPYWSIEITNRIEELSIDDLSVDEAMWIFDLQRDPEELKMAIAQKLQADMSPRVMEDNDRALAQAVLDIWSGKDKVKIVLRDVLCNYPDVALCQPERIYVPVTSGYDPQKCDYIIHEFFLPLRVVQSNAENKGWNKLSASEITLKQTTDLDDKTLDIDKDQREGIERLQASGSLVKIWECYCWYDINNDGEEEKCVITVAPDFDKVLRKISLPFYSGKFPFVKLFYELIDDRWFSHRGIPELIEDIVKEIDLQHMQKLDYGTMTNSPMFIYRAGMVNPQATRFIFGQGIPAHGMSQLDDLMKPLQMHNSNINFAYKDEQMILETKVEELIGQQDFSLQSMINKRQPRTLGEVQMQHQNMQQVFSLDSELMRMQFEDLFNWVWDLWSQYGDDQYEFAYFGKSGWEKIKLGREEVQAKYKLTVRGNDQNTNPQVRLQKAQAIMMALQNPVALQTGVITPIHIANSFKRFYQELDIPNWEELVATPEQIMQQMQRQSQQPPPDDIKVQFDELTEAEQAQVIAKRGINPDAQGRFIRESKDRQMFALEKGLELAKVANAAEKESNGQRTGANKQNK